MNIVKNVSELIVGAWYAIGVENLAGVINWSGAELAKYEGDGCWSDDAREPVSEVWDAECQMMIGANEADAYMAQS